MPWSRIVDAFVGSDGGGALLHVAKLAKILGETGGETGGEICMLSKQIHAKGVPECLSFVLFGVYLCCSFDTASKDAEIPACLGQECLGNA